jgi:hypothetical protein
MSFSEPIGVLPNFGAVELDQSHPRGPPLSEIAAIADDMPQQPEIRTSPGNYCKLPVQRMMHGTRKPPFEVFGPSVATIIPLP